jgi:hypothetical protein
LPWDDLIVIIDEAHNLKMSHHTVDSARMSELRDALTNQNNSDLYLFTATPVEETVEDLEELLDIVKGLNGDEKNDEGFFSYYRATSSNKPVDYEKEMPRIICVELQGVSKTKYIEKMKSTKSVIELNQMSKLKPYCSMSTLSTFAQKKDWLKKFTKDPTSYATKLAAVAQYISKTNNNTIVLIGRTSGYLPLLHILADKIDMNVVSMNDVDESCEGSCEDSCFFGFAPKSVLSELSSKTFNKAGTGVNFINIRRLIIVDVPEDTNTYLKNVKRVLRCCACAERVDILMFAAELYYGKTTTADEYFLRKLAIGLVKNNALVKDLRAISIEGINS